MLVKVSNVVFALDMLALVHCWDQRILPSQHARTLGMKSWSRSTCSWMSRLSSIFETLGSSYMADSVALVLLFRRLVNDPRRAETLGRSMLLIRLETDPCTSGSVDVARCGVTCDCRIVGTWP